MSGLVRIASFNWSDNDLILNNVFARIAENRVQVTKQEDGSWQLQCIFAIAGSRQKALDGRFLSAIPYTKIVQDVDMRKDVIKLLNDLFKAEYSAVDD